VNEKSISAEFDVRPNRRRYIAPALSNLGSFSNLTRDAAKNSYVDMSAMVGMMMA
jgi:hypothetical protein